MNQGPRFLRGEDGRLGVKPRGPTSIDGLFIGDFVGEFEKDFEVAEFGGEQGKVELGEFWFAFGGGFREDGESFAGAGFNKGGDEEAVEEFVGAAVADVGTEVAGVGGLVGTDEATAPFDEHAGDLGEMGRFVASDTRHGFHPAGEPNVRPASHQVHGVVGSLHFQKGMVVEQSDGVGEGGVAPGEGGAGAEGKGVELFVHETQE